MNQDFQIRHGSKHYRPCNQYKHRFHRSHHRSLLGGQSVKKIWLLTLPIHAPVSFSRCPMKLHLLNPVLRSSSFEKYLFNIIVSVDPSGNVIAILGNTSFIVLSLIKVNIGKSSDDELSPPRMLNRNKNCN